MCRWSRRTLVAVPDPSSNAVSQSIRQPATYLLGSPLHRSGFLGPNFLGLCHHPSRLRHHNKVVDFLSSSRISSLQLPTSRRLGHRASSLRSPEPYKTVFHTVSWLFSDETVLTWTVQIPQSCSVRHCPQARFPTLGRDVEFHVDVEIGWLD